MHTPVLLDEIRGLLALGKSGTPHSPVVCVDGTFGRGGHTDLVLQSVPHSKIWAFDRDPDAIAWGKAQTRYRDIQWVQGCFSRFKHYISGQISAMILDLGVSSPQLDQAERGFSFRYSGPLDMRMSQSGPTARDLLKYTSEKELSHIFWTYGQERRARYLAKVVKRYQDSLETTTDLAQLVCQALGIEHTSFAIHPATRIFQALRIVVNQELEVLYQTLPQAIGALAPLGILIVISFHSLEDGIVKRAMQACPKNHYHTSKKPIVPSLSEVKKNPRVRSSKLRWIQRCESCL